MAWTTDACQHIRELDGVVDVSLAETTDGLPFSKSFRAEVQLASTDEPVTEELLENILRCVYESGGRNVPRGSFGFFFIKDGVRKNLRAHRLPLPDGLRGWGSSVTVPAGWLHERFGRR